MVTNTGLWPIYGSRVQGWMPGCPMSAGTSPKHYGWEQMPECPGWQLMGSNQCLAWGDWGCLNCPWTRQDNLESARSCNELWVQVLLGLTGRWTGKVKDVMLSSIALEVTWISQNC